MVWMEAFLGEGNVAQYWASDEFGNGTESYGRDLFHNDDRLGSLQVV